MVAPSRGGHDLCPRVGITKPTTSARLAKRVDGGLPARRLYRERASVPAIAVVWPEPLTTYESKRRHSSACTVGSTHNAAAAPSPRTPSR